MEDWLKQAQKSRRPGMMFMGKDGELMVHYQLATTKEGVVIRIETFSGQTWTFVPATVVGGGYWQMIDEGE